MKTARKQDEGRRMKGLCVIRVLIPQSAFGNPHLIHPSSFILHPFAGSVAQRNPIRPGLTAADKRARGGSPDDLAAPEAATERQEGYVVPSGN